MKKNYDSGFCGSLPLHFINSIQPYGVLLVVNRSNFEIIQTSENVQLVGLGKPEDILHKTLADFISAEDWTALRKKLERKDLKERIPLHFGIQGTKCRAIAHFKDQQLLLEIEKASSGTDFSEVYAEVKYILSTLKNATDILNVCEIATHEIKRLSGFDKVMIYKFDSDWNGTVLAEAKEEGMDSYLGLRFPASDVPKQARDLYIKNPYRWIPDSSYEPIKLNPLLSPATFTFTDLSDCNLRGVAPVHLEYLKNMKVGASMSTPIIKDDKLWGLISCHHKQPRELDYNLRSAFELLSNIISSQLSAKTREEELIQSSNLSKIHSSLYKKMMTHSSLVQGLQKGVEEMLSLLDASGFVLIYDEKITSFGKTPEEAHIKEIVFWLRINSIKQIYTTDTVETAIDPVSKYKDVASGFIAIPLSSERGDYILGFRPEVIQTVQWGGNPNDAIQFEANEKTYHPRNSFSIWKENVGSTSLPWQYPTIKAAEELQKSIKEILLRHN